MKEAIKKSFRLHRNIKMKEIKHFKKETLIKQLSSIKNASFILHTRLQIVMRKKIYTKIFF